MAQYLIGADTRVPKVLGETQASKFLETKTYTNGLGYEVPRAIYNFPKREACLMAMSYSYELQSLHVLLATGLMA